MSSFTLSLFHSALSGSLMQLGYVRGEEEEG
jgi:hypothetical protein